ncbi:MAG: FkbM family methyltransferase [Solirubrobacteraceae bacterium]
MRELAELLRPFRDHSAATIDDEQLREAYLDGFSHAWAAVHGGQLDIEQVRRLAADQLASRPSESLPPAGLDVMTDIRRLVSQEGRAHPVLLDVGANIGQSVDLFLREFPGCELHCFEPVPSAFRRLQAHVARHSNVHIHQVGVGARPGTAVIIENSYSDMSSMLELGSAGWGTAVARHQVPIVSIGDYCAAHGLMAVDVLKIDTQGYELEVLAGASSLLARGAIRLVYLEVIFSPMYVSGAAAADVFRFLAAHGYALVGMYDFHYRSGRAGWADALFCKD